MQRDEGLGIDANLFGVTNQIFNGGLVVQDHLGFQRILARCRLTEFDQSFGVEPGIGVTFQM